MKQILQMLSPVLFAGFVLSGCQNTPVAKADPNAASIPDTIRTTPVPTEGAVPFRVTEGTVYWQAKKAIGQSHDGTISVAKGELMVNQNRLLSGSITLDMPTIAVTNLNDAGERSDLESHLKDKDFFDVAQFPEATFTITEVLPSNLPAFNWVVRGDLNIKGATNSVNIPVNMTIQGDQLKAESATFLINRTRWGLNFRSGTLGTAKDKIIEDAVMLSLKIKAKR